jgi:hypothetical protein
MESSSDPKLFTSVQHMELLRLKARHVCDLVEARLRAFSGYQGFLDLMLGIIQGHREILSSCSLNPDSVRKFSDSQGAWKMSSLLAEGVAQSLASIVLASREFVDLHRKAEESLGEPKALSLLELLDDEYRTALDKHKLDCWKEALCWFWKHGLSLSVFRRLGSVSNAPWVNLAKGNIVKGILENVYERRDERSISGTAKFFQIKLVDSCECRVGTGETAKIVRSEAGTVVNLNYNPRTAPLEELVPQIMKGAEYEVWVGIGDKLKLPGGRSMWDMEVAVKMTSPVRPERSSSFEMKILKTVAVP